ncbi:helix-turn-helix domain-containing protein [Pectinatus frisingensis]|uniref:helix-turn-helix domain-containing protein n=1 Tax=Pectinatus frisingensis TaxID=865 RepID=UPI0018C69F3B|nr:helix-turn-helix domain-containing protein [Pectinatus frisingensis]
MSVIKANRNENYTVMANYHLRDKKLSLASKGLMSFMLSLPNTWEFSISGLAVVLSTGKDQIRSRLKELEKHGYLHRHKRARDKKGRLTADVDYELYERPKDNPYVKNILELEEKDT